MMSYHAFFVAVILFSADAFAQENTNNTRSRLVTAAMERLSHDVTYDGSYQRITYPGGDVPDDIGVCTDLIVRAYRGVGIDLQQLIHEDMQTDFAAYPQFWGLTRPDSNIDHRRVPNLQVFFERHGVALVSSLDGDDYQPGDIVSWMLPSSLPHIGIVSDERSADGSRLLVIHNIGAGPKMDDRLFEFPITGHYRYIGASADTQVTTVFASNYDVVLTVNGEINHAQSSAKVRAGHTIPVELQRHKVGLTVLAVTPGKYAVVTTLFEKSHGDWFPISVDIPELDADLGSPMTFTWEANDIRLDVALVVGLASH